MNIIFSININNSNLCFGEHFICKLIASLIRFICGNVVWVKYWSLSCVLDWVSSVCCFVSEAVGLITKLGLVGLAIGLIVFDWNKHDPAWTIGKMVIMIDILIMIG